MQYSSTTPYSLKPGSKVDFEARTISATRLEYFSIDLNSRKETEPTFYKQPDGVEAFFHFNSIHPLSLLPPNILAIRATILNDATLLGFRVPHFMSDSQTVCDIVSAYADILAEKNIRKLVPPPDVEVLASSFKEDTPVDIGLKLENIPFLHIKHVVGVELLAFINFVCFWMKRRITGKLFPSTKSEEKFIYLPKLLVQNWRVEIKTELDTQDTENSLKLTELDVITAWLLQNTYDQTDTKPVDLTHEFSYRHILPPPEKGTTDLKSSQYELRVTVPSTSTQTQKVAAIRSTVLASRQASIVKMNLEYMEAATNTKTIFSPLVGRMAYITSWGRDDFFGLDFSGTVERGGRKANVVFVVPRIELPFGILQAPFVTILKVGKEGYWVRANLSREGWKGFGVCMNGGWF